ncbi:MAG: aminotransferase class V-fold PLP-dependent enzyme [Chloroflexi bacterium]|nr:aminotransferase class V-fold PLP-dependent enzyme [Chloroflexota bacterium]
MRRPIDLDHAATTPTDPRVVEAMLPYFSEIWGNPSSIYSLGRAARRALDRGRDTMSEILGCKPSEVLFTSCGTESDNLAIKGVAFARQAEGRHLITTRIEHHAVLHCFEWLEKYFGFDVTYLGVDAHGVVDPDTVARALRPDTTLVSIMLANNEVGTIEPIAEISRLLRSRRIAFHTDAVQAAGLMSLDVESLGVDLLSLSGHKVYAPKGVGLLYLRRGTPYFSTMLGGGQERGLRAGTENAPYVVGFARAMELAYGDLDSRVRSMRRSRDRLIVGVLSTIRGSELTGHPTDRLANSASFVFSETDGESILLNLDQEGLCASSGSACTAGSLEVSHVLKALGIPLSHASGSLRLSVGVDTDDEEIDATLEILPRIIERVRSLRPVEAPAAR